MNKIKVKIINKSDNPLPEYKKLGDAGMDVRAMYAMAIKGNETAMVNTGLYMEIPEGYNIEIRPRSGLALKHGITVLNAPGTIDSSYRGEVCVILHNTKPQGTKSESNTFQIQKGDRIAQLVLQKVPKIEWEEVNELSKTDRGVGGIGHTGVK